MITVLLFAQLKENVGHAEVELELEHVMTVTELKKIMQIAYNTGELDHVITAINEEYVLNDDTVHPGDTVAFIPPVSGG